VPADVLFVGEAPGSSEDVLSQPFRGPAGILLDHIVQSALPDPEPSICFTNLVACIPKGESGTKMGEPLPVSIEACAPRLIEFIKICKPRLFICVGTLATKWLPKILKNVEWYRDQATVSIVHPAFIKRAEEYAQPLIIKKCIITLSDSFAEL
jgi:DNA polymerase